MNDHLSGLIEISRYYGQKKDYVIAGGGNTSFKNSDRIWVKASGVSMKDITADGFAELDRAVLKTIYSRKYNTDSLIREAEVKEDLYRACLKGNSVRPSVETSLHEIIDYAYVVHTHPTLVNAVMCSVSAGKTISDLFGNDAIFVPYTDPGYILFTKIRDSLYEWRKSHENDPQLIFLQNHGVFVSANSVEEIRRLYDSVESTIKDRITEVPGLSEIEISQEVTKWLPALRMMFSENASKIATIRNSELIEYYTSSAEKFREVSRPFTPDQIVYCKAQPLFIESEKPADIIEECRRKLSEFRAKMGYTPRIAGIKGFGLAAFDDNSRSAGTALDIFIDWMKICRLSANFQGPNYLSERDVSFIDNWEVENYRRQVAKTGISTGRRLENKIAVVTGGAQGFGEGISENMFMEGANMVIADINSGKGNALAAKLNSYAGKNESVFCITDVTDPVSVQRLIYNVVIRFGGLDVFVSNAGILKAGGLDEMTVENFDSITKVNYSGYFICAKYASDVMKLQAEYQENHFSDIIQINSKSGLKGSNRNFAYAGSKFGSIGLTQSFALELMPWRIKVNAVCPGNFFEGPLWSDPVTGLFVQYLKAGKVPGAVTIADVKAHYEMQVPAGRGCRIEDVMKAIYYLIEQEYETGQALPVTGGQEMLR